MLQSMGSRRVGHDLVTEQQHMYTVECHSVIKQKNETLPFAATQMYLEGIIPSEINQIEKDKYCMISLVYRIQNTTN